MIKFRTPDTITKIKELEDFTKINFGITLIIIITPKLIGSYVIISFISELYLLQNKKLRSIRSSGIVNPFISLKLSIHKVRHIRRQFFLY